MILGEILEFGDDLRGHEHVIRSEQILKRVRLGGSIVRVVGIINWT
jgi:hypothetical protein